MRRCAEQTENVNYFNLLTEKRNYLVDNLMKGAGGNGQVWIGKLPNYYSCFGKIYSLKNELLTGPIQIHISCQRVIVRSGVWANEGTWRILLVDHHNDHNQHKGRYAMPKSTPPI